MDASNSSLCAEVGEDNCDFVKNDALQDNALHNNAQQKNYEEDEQLKKTMSTINDATTFSEDNDQLLTDNTTIQQYHCAAINCPRVFHSSTDRDQHVRETGHNGVKSCLSSTRNKRLHVFNDNLAGYEIHAFHSQESYLLDSPLPSQYLPDSHHSKSDFLDPQNPYLLVRQLEVNNVEEQPQSSNISFRCHWTPNCIYETVVESTYKTHIEQHLKKHLTSQLVKSNTKSTEKDRINSQVSKQTIKQYNKCADCGSSYSSPSHLDRHVRTSHNGPKSHLLYRCTWTGDCFFSSGTHTGMINHLRVHLSRDPANAHYDDGGRVVWSKHYVHFSD